MGEGKSSMKNKLLAITVVLLLLTSVFAAGFRSASATEWRILTISYLPSGMPAPATVPALGTYNLSKGSTVVLEAPDLVYADDDVRYKFDAWCLYNEETGTWSNRTDNPRSIRLDYNYTAYARYKIQYKVTVEVPSSPDWEANFTAWVWDPLHGWQTNHNTTVSTWVYNGTQVRAMIQGQRMFGPSPAMPGVWRKGRTAYARFENWTGIGVWSVDSTNYYAYSNLITVTGPTKPAVEWAMYYKLDISYDPSWIGGPWSSWEKECTNVTISASTTGQWAPEYIEVDGVKVPANTVGTPPCVVYCNYTFTLSYVNLTITVHMNANHTVVVHWTRRVYITFADSGCPSGASGVSKYTGYYFPNWNYTFTAPPYTNETECRRYRFLNWYVPTIGYLGNLTNRDITLNISTALDGKTIYARYQLQFRVRLFTEPAALLGEGIPLKLTGDVPEGSGWFDLNTYAYFGAPIHFGEDEWSNGTRYEFVKWTWDGTYTSYNETRWKVDTCKNFTAVYKKQYSVEVSAEPADFAWEKTYWVDEDGPTYILWANGMWTDPGGLNYYFDHWEVTEGPSAGLIYPTSQSLWLNMTGPYKVVAIYRNGTALMAIQDEAYFVGAGGAYCKEFEITMMILNIEGMYSAEFKLTWSSEYLELVAVDTSPLDEVWTNYFVAKGDDVPATPGEYEFVATAVGNDTEPFSGTAALVTLTFHIIKEPETVGTRRIPINIASYRFLNKTGADISIDYTKGGECTIETPKPYLKMSAKIEDCGSTMIVYIEAQNVTRLYEYYLKISYPSSQLKVIDITVEKTFLQGPYSVQYVTFDGGYITIHVRQASGVPPANGTGILAVITFEILVGPGVSIDPITWDRANTWIKELTNPGEDPYTPPLGFKEFEAPKQILGDANMDGIVDIFDLRLVALYYGKVYKPADFDNDGRVDLDDLLITAIHFGESMYE